MNTNTEALAALRNLRAPPCHYGGKVLGYFVEERPTDGGYRDLYVRVCNYFEGDTGERLASATGDAPGYQDKEAAARMALLYAAEVEAGIRTFYEADDLQLVIRWTLYERVPSEGGPRVWTSCAPEVTTPRRFNGATAGVAYALATLEGIARSSARLPGLDDWEREARRADPDRTIADPFLVIAALDRAKVARLAPVEDTLKAGDKRSARLVDVIAGRGRGYVTGHYVRSTEAIRSVLTAQHESTANAAK